MINDSGDRTVFTTGAVRDLHGEEKGRCDLMALQVAARVLNSCVLETIGDFVYKGNPELLIKACTEFVDYYYPNMETALLDLSIHYYEGSQKYEERNWEKGIPLHAYIDSGVRHLLKHFRGDTDEHHDRAFLWNMFGALWTLEHMPELNDLPCGGKDSGDTNNR